jgi:hypothetical protein
MGVTYKAIDINLRCEVALKAINARFIGDEAARRRSSEAVNHDLPGRSRIAARTKHMTAPLR